MIAYAPRFRASFASSLFLAIKASPICTRSSFEVNLFIDEMQGEFSIFPEIISTKLSRCKAYPITLPTSTLIRRKTPLESSELRIIPSLKIPTNFTGFRLMIAHTSISFNSSGE